ncbi:N-acetyl-gamma-glutamyl-phosphate reductase [Saccharothrix algeriensis]|uniref:N-acetyl-gamma-glutamyl-phosphate reductase n=1 Tax=Saccharothrix algeriensis TaxID=173560 RepID=A0A8T8HW48_9PSEU|nr:N-acetyl-gamma-glutamyl-phosphate reductase [Saccharothrix algeriensis]MBM7814459.1 N-acetyl-gamma-glutamyl-phosphate reductase common form [Saccharothrix algeriensis]QTR02758.1 N-acetyl-gamma-glutamyl-phosphate reductase [Saccharothrix algeriensis]
MTRSEGLVVGVVGGTGHTGGEVCRLLLGHPAVRTILPTARSGAAFAEVHPNLAGSGLDFRSAEQLADRAEELDVVFFCTPSGEAMRRARHYVDRGVRVVDLGADFRFADPSGYRRVYGAEHADPELLREARYGVTELNREEIAAARLVANPGCYAITAILALAPLLRADLARPGAPVGIHAVNGTTGAGNTPKKAIMHAEVSGAMLSYSLEGHRHGPELEAFLSTLTGHPVTVDLDTAHGNFARGIHLRADVHLGAAKSRDELLELYTGFYGDGHDTEHFVLVNTLPKRGELNEKRYEIYPNLTHVVGSNFCHLGLDVARAGSVARVVAVTDNLVKGAAGSAIQNMNVQLGLDERAGLTAYAL